LPPVQVNYGFRNVCSKSQSVMKLEMLKLQFSSYVNKFCQIKHRHQVMDHCSSKAKVEVAEPKSKLHWCLDNEFGIYQRR
jgi:hypothetical protein